MSDLQNQTPADTYKGLLQVGDYTDGVTNNTGANALQVTDGAGVNTALALSTTRVGVGNSSPQAELDVNGNVVADEYALDGTGSSSSAVAIHAPDTNELAIRTNSAERVRIDSDGNVGIGTTNPGSYKLNISGGNILTEGVVSSTSSGANIVLANSSTEEPYLKFDAKNSSTGINWTLGIVDDDLTDEENLLAFQRYNDLNQLQDTPLVIKSDGNVGIGTDSPDAKLHLEDTNANTPGIKISASDQSYEHDLKANGDGILISADSTNYGGGGADIRFNVSGSEHMRIRKSGKVGIGTDSPDSKFHSVSTNSGENSVHFQNTSSDGYGAKFVGGGNVAIQYIADFRNYAGSSKVKIDGDGHVGIGTEFPSAPLEVSSTTGGVIMPRMATTQMNAISSPTDGEMIYNTTANKFYGRANGAWVALH